MITLLTSELNRINQEIKEEILTGGNHNEWEYKINPSLLELEKEKETLKKVSIMWADGFKEIIDKFRHMVAEDGLRRLQGEEPKLAWSDLFDYFHNELKLKQIKSLMEKA